MASVVLVDNGSLREQHSLRQGWGARTVSECTQCSPRLTKLFWDTGKKRNNTDRKLLLKTTPFLSLRGRNALSWQQAWSFHRGEALNKRLSDAKLFAEVITNHRAESQKVKARCLPSLRAPEPSVCCLLYLFKCHNSSFLLHLPILLLWAANKTHWKADREGSGQNSAGCKEGKDVRAIQARHRTGFLPCLIEDMCCDYKRPYPSRKRL